MFNNPLGHAGYPPGVSGKPNNVNSTVRAATAAEVLKGTKDNVYLTPKTALAPVAPVVAGATPLVNNNRKGQLSFSNVTATTGYFSYVMTNSLVTSSSVIQVSPSCATVNSAVSIVGITPGAGTVTFRVYNAGSASTAANVIINYEILN